MAGNAGKLIVFEGTDGSGKTTQSKLLLNFFRKNKIKAKYISFPRYEDSMWGAMVKRFLAGDFGKLEDVDPYLASCLYAGDRACAVPIIKRWIGNGYFVVCNRYIGSNIGHMAAKFKKSDDRRRYINWLEKLEYGENKIPKEDLVILLQVPIKKTRKMMKGRKLDIHEKDQKYLEQVYSVYDSVAKGKKNWEVVNCSSSGEVLSPEDIHEKVLEILKSRRWF
jgi:dTMP kinase